MIDWMVSPLKCSSCLNLSLWNYNLTKHWARSPSLCGFESELYVLVAWHVTFIVFSMFCRSKHSALFESMSIRANSHPLKINLYQAIYIVCSLTKQNFLFIFIHIFNINLFNLFSHSICRWSLEINIKILWAMRATYIENFKKNRLKPTELSSKTE